VLRSVRREGHSPLAVQGLEHGSTLLGRLLQGVA
jgi:hypothetical protein